MIQLLYNGKHVSCKAPIPVGPASPSNTMSKLAEPIMVKRRISIHQVILAGCPTVTNQPTNTNQCLYRNSAASTMHWMKTVNNKHLIGRQYYRLFALRPSCKHVLLPAMNADGLKLTYYRPGNCLHNLLPREPNVTLLFFSDSRILQFTPIPQVRTKRYCSFINYSLKYYQW